MIDSHPTQRGFVLMSAIFLVVVLAALGAFMVTFSNTQHLTSALDIQGSRAYWAARTGVEWAVSRIAAPAAPVCPASPTLFNVDDFSLVVECSSHGYNEGGITKTVFSITSGASSGGNVGSLGYIERSISATIEFCTPKADCE